MVAGTITLFRNGTWDLAAGGNIVLKADRDPSATVVTLQRDPANNVWLEL